MWLDILCWSRFLWDVGLLCNGTGYYGLVDFHGKEQGQGNMGQGSLLSDGDGLFMGWSGL